MEHIKLYLSVGGIVNIVECNKDCNKCKQLNIKVDDKGYPWGYECLKYGDSVLIKNFSDTKQFIIDG